MDNKMNIRKRRKTTIIMALILLLLLVAAGALFLLRPTIREKQRRAAEELLISQIQAGQTHIEDFSPPEVEGEALEFGELEEPYTAEPRVVTGYGLISIPSIELEMAVVQGADNYALRAAAGWLPESAEMGKAGNCVIFGHHMVEYGQHFNRLDELEEGDKISLYNASGESFTYSVTGKEIIEPSVLMDTLKAHNEGFSLTLVTCTPTGIGSHRLLVYAVLDNQ